MFDPDNYTSLPDLNGSHEADSWSTRSGFIGFMRALIAQSVLWAFVRYGIILMLPGRK